MALYKKSFLHYLCSSSQSNNVTQVSSGVHLWEPFMSIVKGGGYHEQLARALRAFIMLHPPYIARTRARVWSSVPNAFWLWFMTTVVIEFNLFLLCAGLVIMNKWARGATAWIKWQTHACMYSCATEYSANFTRIFRAVRCISLRVSDLITANQRY